MVATMRQTATTCALVLTALLTATLACADGGGTRPVDPGTGGGGGGTMPPPPAAVASVHVTPASASLVVGGTQSLAASARDAAGNALPGRPASWSSSAPAVASIDNAGLVTAVAAGSTTIRATVEGIVGTATITVVATGGGGGGSIFDLRDSVVVATQGFFVGAASSTFSRIAVAPHVDATATTRDLVFLDANGTIEARRNLGGSSWAVAMTPDGTRTVAGSDDENLYFFSGTALVSSGRPITGNIEIRGVAISDDGRWVGAGGGRFTLHDWNAANRVAPVYVDSSTTQLRAIDFAANGRYVAYGGRITASPADPGTTYIAVYDLQARQRVFRELIPCPECSNGELRQLAISADGDRILAGDWGGRLHYYIRDGGTGTWTRTTQSVGSRVYWVDMSADGTRAAVGVQASGVRLFSLGATATQLWERTGTDGGQRTVHITPDARYITASTRGGGGGGGQIVVHDAAGALVLSRASHAVNTGSGHKARGGAAEPEAWFARVSDDGTRALLASYQGVLYFFVRR
jgi:WD40 repeat protein